MAVPMTPPAGAHEFVAQAGWAGAAILPLAGDASFRRYFRVAKPGATAVLMDAPPPHEDARPFVAIARHLRGLGFAAPAILASDMQLGLVLLEDFGDDRLRERLDDEPHREHALYGEAVALLADLHAHALAPVPDYAPAELHREARLFTEWYCPAVGLDVDAGAYDRAWSAAFSRFDGQPRVTVLRDYHSENIMLRTGGGLGLLDFQDALAGHPAYDLVSLLQDARRDVSPAVEAAMRQAYGDYSPDFDIAYAVLGAQRNAKILGIFTRLARRDGKPRYLELLPRVWGYLERDLAHPALTEIADWFAGHVPPALRALPRDGA